MAITDEMTGDMLITCTTIVDRSSYHLLGRSRPIRTDLRNNPCSEDDDEDILYSVVNEDNAMVRLEYHTHFPCTSTTYNNNDEITILINEQYIFTLSCDNYSHIKDATQERII